MREPGRKRAVRDQQAARVLGIKTRLCRVVPDGDQAEHRERSAMVPTIRSMRSASAASARGSNERRDICRRPGSLPAVRLGGACMVRHRCNAVSAPAGDQISRKMTPGPFRRGESLGNSLIHNNLAHSGV